MNKLNFVRTDVKVGSDDFELLYKESAFTMIGCPESGIQNVLENYLCDDNAGPDEVKMGNLQEVDGECKYYVIKGDVMNKQYNLRGDNAYQDELTFLCIPCKYFKDTGMLAMFRIKIDPTRMKWFDDLVDNNKRCK